MIHLELGKLGRKIRERDPMGWQNYLRGLKNTQRWVGGDASPYPNFSETLEEHIDGGSSIIFAIYGIYPKLASAIKVGTVSDIWNFHDAGEIARGDVANTDPRRVNTTDDERKRLNQERAVAERAGFIETVLPWFRESLQCAILQRFDRYHQFSAADKVAQIVKWVDIVDGNANAVQYVYPVNEKHPKTPFKSERTLNFTLKKFFYQTYLVSQLLNEYSREELQFVHFASVFLKSYMEHGYAEEVERYEEKYPQLYQRLMQNMKVDP